MQHSFCHLQSSQQFQHSISSRIFCLIAGSELLIRLWKPLSLSLSMSYSITNKKEEKVHGYKLIFTWKLNENPLLQKVHSIF